LQGNRMRLPRARDCLQVRGVPRLNRNPPCADLVLDAPSRTLLSPTLNNPSAVGGKPVPPAATRNVGVVASGVRNPASVAVNTNIALTDRPSECWRKQKPARKP
jgi:hypothetical protein